MKNDLLRLAVFQRENGSFLGRPCRQVPADLILWEILLNVAGPWGSIVEIGTDSGAFSTFLGLQARERGARFLTMDNNRKAGSAWAQAPAAQSVAHCCHIPAKFFEVDCFSEYGIELVREWIGKPGRLLLACDGGNKAREVCTFAPMLKPGDVIAAHDWNREIWQEHIEPVSGILEPLLPADCELCGSWWRWWRRK